MEMIAMLDGLGMNTEYPIGDVNPASSPRYYNEPRPASQPPAPPTGMPAYAPLMNYPLGALGESDTETAPPAGGAGHRGLGDIPISTWLAIAAFTILAIPLLQKLLDPKKEAPVDGLGAGFAEPEMITFPAKKRRRRRK